MVSFQITRFPILGVKILDMSDLMDHTRCAKNTVVTKENNLHHFGFAAHFTYFQTQEGREMLLSFMVTAVVQNFVTCYDIF
jgi:hypothetical protein